QIAPVGLQNGPSNTGTRNIGRLARSRRVGARRQNFGPPRSSDETQGHHHTEASLLWTPGQPVVEPVPVRGFYHVASCRVKDLAEADRSIVQSRGRSYAATPRA